MASTNVLASTPECHYQFKLVIVGDSNVGKSSLLMRLMDKSFFNDHFTTIGADCVSNLLPLCYIMTLLGRYLPLHILSTFLTSASPLLRIMYFIKYPKLVDLENENHKTRRIKL